MNPVTTFHECEQKINKNDVTSHVECDEHYVISSKDDDGSAMWMKTETKQKLELLSDIPSISVRFYGV